MQRSHSGRHSFSLRRSRMIAEYLMGNPPVLRAKRRSVEGWKAVGSFLIDVRTKSVGRIAKASGVFPDMRNATELIEQIKLMLRELDTNRDIPRLTQIRLGKVHLLDALAAWKAGRLHFAESYAGDLLLPSLEQWLTEASISPITVRQYRNYIRRLQKLGHLTPGHRVRDLPEVLRAARIPLARDHKGVYFGNIRQMAMSYLVNHLGYDDESHVLRDVRRVPPIRIKARREHHPLRGVADLVELGSRINTSGRWGNREVDYKSWIYFMAITGMRPTEFERGLWERDETTGHLRILGTKTRNAIRVIPLITWLEPDKRPLGSLQMRLVHLTPATTVRCRDFRRTAAVWYEQAGVPRSRYAYYLGHGPRDMTALYERRIPTKAELDTDRDTMLRWIDRQRSARPAAHAPVEAPAAHAFIQALETPSAGARPLAPSILPASPP